MGKQTRRNPRREVARRFRRDYEDPRLDLEAQVAQERPKALLFGIAVAFGAYAFLFGLAYLAWSLGRIDAGGLAKLSWTLMVPGVMVGAGAWLINRSRREYPVRQAIRAHLERLEGRGGRLWCYTPLLPEDVDPAFKRACRLSREGKLDKIDLEDYLGAVAAIRRRLEGDEPLPEALAQEVLDCLEGKTAR